MATKEATIIGFIGLGLMGSALVERLIERGWTVIAYNRTREKTEKLAAATAGKLQIGTSPADVATRSRVVFMMVTDSSASRAIIEGEDGILRADMKGKIVVDMSTVSPEVSIELAEKVRKHGGDMVDCPISGSHISIKLNKASTMVGGNQATFDFLQPILLDIGPKTTLVGSNGKALSLKVAMNLNLGAQMLAFAESVLLAERAGIDRKTAVDVLMGSAVGSPMLQYRGPLVLGLPEEAYFSTNMMQKDLLLALEMGRKLRVPLPTTSLANEWLTAGRGMGFGQEDFATLFHVLSRIAGNEEPIVRK